MNRTTGIVVSVALLSVAGLVAAYLFTHKPEPEGPSVIDQSIERAHEEKVACLEGGGTWLPGINSCQQRIGQPPSTASGLTGGIVGSFGGGSGEQTIGEYLTEQIVDQMLPNMAQQAKFCVTVDQLGYFAALQAFKRGYDAQTPSAQKVFAEAYSRCV